MNDSQSNEELRVVFFCLLLFLPYEHLNEHLPDSLRTMI